MYFFFVYNTTRERFDNFGICKVGVLESCVNTIKFTYQLRDFSASHCIIIHKIVLEVKHTCGMRDSDVNPIWHSFRKPLKTIYTYTLKQWEIFSFFVGYKASFEKEISCQTLTYQNISILNLGSHNISFCD